MNYQEVITTIEFEWEPDKGFFWHIRQGLFSDVEFSRALKKISSISVPDDALIPKRLVSLLWYIPSFMHWQVERVEEAGGDMSAYIKAITAISNEIERVLGVP